jgi:hypothetical protein
MTGYHIRNIDKGVLGEISKIREELDELEDAHEQGIRIMELNELADMFGAMEDFLLKYHPGTSMDDLRKMAHVTRRAFANGRR